MDAMLLKTSFSLAGVLLLGLASSAQTNASISASQPVPCTEARQKQFDFLVGDWNLTWPGQNGGISHGTNHVMQVLGGCAVEENFSAGPTNSLRGMSVSTFDMRLGKWKQTWVDNKGASVDFIGEFDHGQMTLQREATKSDGTRVFQRMVYKNISANEFDWSWESSQDGGRTWQVLWPIHYKRNSMWITR